MRKEKLSTIENNKHSYIIKRIFNLFFLFGSIISLAACENTGSNNLRDNKRTEASIYEEKHHKESKPENKNRKTGDIDKINDIEVINKVTNASELNSLQEDYDKQDKQEKDEKFEKHVKSVSLIMVGDILLHDAVNKCFENEEDEYDYLPIFNMTRNEIGSADIAIVNQEVIIGGKQLGVSGYPSFNAPEEIGDALAEAGFDIVCHATNHALDRGKRGLLNCMDYWEENHPEVEVLGIHDSREDSEEIYICEKNGIKIAFLNYTYGTNGINPPEDMRWSIDLLNEKNKEKIVNDIKKAEKMADLTVVCPHWGTEYSLDISEEQEKWSKVFIENGVDLVIGTHPHVIEPIELVEDEKTGNKMLVYYSLGNYVNWTSGEGPGTANRMVGGMARVDIGYDDAGKVTINDYGVEALVCHLKKEKEGIKVYRLKDYTEELAEENAIRLQDSDFSLNYCTALCDEVWDDLWE